jgi:hypothetical protein
MSQVSVGGDTGLDSSVRTPVGSSRLPPSPAVAVLSRGVEDSEDFPARGIPEGFDTPFLL